uniref:Uncharacterized protein n=1 Tax=Meloidogyne enterolobii TaxID=390850 RepID=A0A6V7VVY8_MELEN|nr:unnamed protein product [Meloidogyne enterolobii]
MLTSATYSHTRLSLHLLLLAFILDVEAGNFCSICINAPKTLIHEDTPSQSNRYSSSADTDEKEIEKESLMNEEIGIKNKEMYDNTARNYYTKHSKESEIKSDDDIEGAGPSKREKLPKKVDMPETENIGFYVNQVLDAIKIYPVYDSLRLIYSSRLIIEEITKKFKDRIKGGDTFLRVVSNKEKYFCNDWLLNKLKEKDILESLQLLYDESCQSDIQEHRTKEPKLKEGDNLHRRSLQHIYEEGSSSYYGSGLVQGQKGLNIDDSDTKNDGGGLQKFSGSQRFKSSHRDIQLPIREPSGQFKSR